MDGNTFFTCTCYWTRRSGSRDQFISSGNNPNAKGFVRQSGFRRDEIF